MIHYHVWFTLKPNIKEPEGLAIVRAFMSELTDRGAIAHVRLLRNLGDAPKSKLPRFHALFEFADDQQMDLAFAAQRTEGIHVGAHGRLLASVGEMQVEVFKEL